MINDQFFLLLRLEPMQRNDNKTCEYLDQASNLSEDIIRSINWNRRNCFHKRRGE